MEHSMNGKMVSWFTTAQDHSAWVVGKFTCLQLCSRQLFTTFCANRVIVNQFLCLIKHNVMETWGYGDTAPRSLNSALDDGVVDFTPRPLHHQERAAGTHWIEEWVGPRAGMDPLARIKLWFLCRSDCNAVTVLTELFRFLWANLQKQVEPSLLRSNKG